MGAGSAPELRVEELAGRADVSVDTIRFYQKRRLLPPPERRGRIAWYGAEHVERLARIKDLQRRGFSLAVIRRIVTGELDRADEPLAAAVAARSTMTPIEAGAEEFLTLDELAERSGVPEALIESIVREGLLVPRRHEGDARFTTADVDDRRRRAASPRDRSADAGAPRRWRAGTTKRRARPPKMRSRCSTTYVREPLRAADLSDDERAERLVEAFRVLLPSVTALVGHHFRRVLLEVAQEHLESVGEPAELEAANAEASRRLEVVWP